ncbi:ArsB/NhaD family transporter [Luteipulveratus sp. YIM 133132]|uniref:SLC13 family permease n=1 Tax=Luteipulveratus flavus TaxID=3031728 RepID=UPI0023AF1802|nr:SLC13 family permease [Luteipulveratus sp. YIM 133132]MDE9367505.1 ArsB/NhaD family transporter [Luteipulveratus sp. YIM 133132]
MSTSDLAELTGHVLPVMVFLIMITIVAEIADMAGVFDVAGHWAARAGRHRTWLLWLLVVALSTVCTIVLSLDTTAVLLTPVVIAVARQVGVRPMPFAVTTVWLANTASLLLPVSNLTNLLALHRFSGLGLTLHDYIALTWRPALAAVVATAVVIAVLHRHDLRGTYAIEPPADPHDRTLLIVAATVCVALGPAFVSGVMPAIPAAVGAAVLLATLAVRRREMLREVTVPWLMVGAVTVLLVVVEIAGQHGMHRHLAGLTGTGTDAADLWQVSAAGAVTSNVVNNLPAYLALERLTIDDPHRLVALLIGTNLGPIVTVWGSLATLLWRERCRRAGLEIPLAAFALRSALCAIVVVAAATTALTL